MKNKKGSAIVWNSTIGWIIAIVVLLVLLGFSFFLKDRLYDILDKSFGFLSFGK